MWSLLFQTPRPDIFAFLECRFIIVGSTGAMHFYKVNLKDATLLKQTKRSEAQGKGAKRGPNNALASAVPTSISGVNAQPQVIKRMFQPLKGPELTHKDIIKAICCTDTHKILTVGLDRYGAGQVRRSPPAGCCHHHCMALMVQGLQGQGRACDGRDAKGPSSSQKGHRSTLGGVLIHHHHLSCLQVSVHLRVRKGGEDH